ncbi:EF-hand domain-containing protein 1 isoform X2 [Acanthochromis polyacanthus]|uniref:EF-hand domain-containing protein 1 isoform X2 n=1 Tax=Acanthochromis polyacanthus TaxID=80966 RepID=UPI00223410E9|nr:EF-hand domain-containing protein 1 isoform X2 [Acanthochromis polyacanthus]
MSWNLNNHGLPFLPGYTFRDVTKSSFNRRQTLGFKNGFRVPHRPTVGIGHDPLVSEKLTQQELSELCCETPGMTYGSCPQTACEDFIPAYVAFDKKVLCYHAYFVEDFLDSPEEQYCVRPVVIYYYLEDDSMCIFEPTVQNSGLMQGKRLKRQRLPKNEHGEHFQWKDLNLGMDLEVYGVKYHITHCDAFTKEFMESEGIILNDPEPMPVDPYSKPCSISVPQYTTPSPYSNMYEFPTMDGKVLCFSALWDDTDSLNGDTRRVTITYFLVDNTVEIREVVEPNSGRIPFLMRRKKIPKKFQPVPFPSCVMEISDKEVGQYYSPKDFQLGQTIKILGRCFLLCDCDRFTKEYYQRNHPDMEMTPTEVPKKVDKPQEKREIPTYNGFGSLEDSLQNCLSLIPKPPKMKFLKMLENDGKVLQYSARLDSQYPQDEVRRFILCYHLSNDMISIYEKNTRNSGIIGGKFLKMTRIPKPGSTVENPEFYSPADFAIGATVEVFSHRFVLTDADRYVLTYLESISSQIPSHTLDSVRQKLGVGISHNQPVDQNGEAAELSS